MADAPTLSAQQHMERAVAFYSDGRLAEAEASGREALRLAPENLNAHAILGAVLRAAGRADEALAVYGRALAMQPDAATLLTNRANLLNDLKRWDAALADASRAAADPANVVALNAAGNALSGLGRWREAAGLYEQALAAQPAYAGAWINLGKARLQANDAAGALAAASEAARLAPGDAGAHLGRGHALSALGRWADAKAAYDAAHALDPAEPFLAGGRLHAAMKACDWRDFDALVADLRRQVAAGHPASTPFAALAAPLSAGEQRRCAETYVAASFAPQPRPAPAAPSGRIRLGYFSADLQDHAVAYLIAELLELHDRDRFEVTAFSFGPPSDGAIRRRLMAAVERFEDVRTLGADAVCRRARALGLDLAVDLQGFTTHARPEIFAQGAAPVQVNYLGYPGTLGAPFADYIVADRQLIGPDDVAAYSEAVAWLPDAYQPNDRRRPVAPQTSTRHDHGLPRDGVVFAALNAAYKITPEVFGAWARILAATPGSVLWLLEDGADAVRNLRQAAAGAALDPARLVFAPKRPLAEHLARQAHADLFLDTTPYGGHTTTSDALWVGLPVLTIRGATFASRVAASLLSAAGLPELIAPDLAAYEASAIRLAMSPDELAALRRRVGEARTTSPLFDTPAYTRNLERLFTLMHERRLAGLPPAPLS